MKINDTKYAAEYLYKVIIAMKNENIVDNVTS